MKKLIVLVVAAFVLFGSCQLPFGETGSLQIQLMGVKSGRAAVLAGDPIRLQLLRNGQIFPVKGKDYLEENAAGQTIVLDGIPAGSGYKVLVAAGKYLPTGYFLVNQFGQSATFEVLAGADQDVAVAPTNSLLEAKATGGRGAVALVKEANNTVLYWLDGNQITDGTMTRSTAALGTATVNSFSTGFVDRNANGTLGAERLVINTTKGLSYLDAEGVKTPEVTHTTSTSKKVSTYPSIDFSSSWKVIQDAEVRYIHMFAGPGLTAGGLVVKANPTDDNADWIETDLKDIPKEISDILEKERIVRGFAFTDNFAFVSTALGTYRITRSMITRGSDKVSEYFSLDYLNNDPLDENHLSLKVEPESSIPVGPVATAWIDETKSGLVFLGTYKGLYAGVIDKTGQITSGPTKQYTQKYDSTTDPSDLDNWTKTAKMDKDNKPVTKTEEEVVSQVYVFDGKEKATRHLATLVAETQNLDITMTQSVVFGGEIWTAAYSANSRELLILKNRTIVKTLSSFAGLPAGLHSLVWYPGTDLKLAMAGTNATLVWTVVVAP